MCMDTTTSRRQGHDREVLSEGSRRRPVLDNGTCVRCLNLTRTARCGPACRVVWGLGGLKPPGYPLRNLPFIPLDARSYLLLDSRMLCEPIRFFIQTNIGSDMPKVEIGGCLGSYE